MKCHCVEYYSGENHIKNTTKICFHKRIFSNLLTIAGILLVLVLNCIIICDKSETKNAEIYDIYRRNLSEVKCVEHSGLRGNNEKVELKNNIAFSSEGYNSKDHLKYNGVRTMKRCNNINYNDLSKQFTLEELHTVLDNLEERPSNEDFYGIWNHVLGINKEGFEDKVKYLWLYIEDYLKKYEYQCYHVWDPLYPICVNIKIPYMV